MPKKFPLTPELLADRATWDERRYMKEFPDKDPVAVVVLVVFLVVLAGLLVVLVRLVAHAGEPSPAEAGYLDLAAGAGAVLLLLVVVGFIARQVGQRRADREEL